MAFSEQEFLEQFPPGDYREAIRAFVEELQTMGCQVIPTKQGVSIRKSIPGRKSMVTVGWIAPPGVKMRPGARDVTLGTWTNPKADGLQPIADSILEQLEIRSFRLGTYGTMTRDASGVRFGRQLFMERRQEVLDLLRNLAQYIDKVAEWEQHNEEIPVR